jgi:hypothetical protein
MALGSSPEGQKAPRWYAETIDPSAPLYAFPSPFRRLPDSPARGSGSPEWSHGGVVRGEDVGADS